MAWKNPAEIDYQLWGGWVLVTALACLIHSSGAQWVKPLLGSSDIKYFNDLKLSSAVVASSTIGVLLTALGQMVLLKWRFEGFPAVVWCAVGVLGIFAQSGCAAFLSNLHALTLDLSGPLGNQIIVARLTTDFGKDLAALCAALVHAFLLAGIFKGAQLWFSIGLAQFAVSLITAMILVFTKSEANLWIVWILPLIFATIKGYWLATADLTGLPLDRVQTPS